MSDKGGVMKPSEVGTLEAWIALWLEAHGKVETFEVVLPDEVVKARNEKLVGLGVPPDVVGNVPIPVQVKRIIQDKPKEANGGE